MYFFGHFEVYICTHTFTCNSTGYFGFQNVDLVLHLLTAGFHVCCGVLQCVAVFYLWFQNVDLVLHLVTAEFYIHASLQIHHPVQLCL